MRSPAAGAHDAAVAAALACVLAATEYAFRHYLLFWLPRMGSWRVNDMAALALAYALLLAIAGAIARAAWRAELGGVGRALRELATRWTYLPWILAMFLSLVVLSVVDQVLWGNARLPIWVSAYRNPAIWFASEAALLTAVSLIAVNGSWCRSPRSTCGAD